MKQMIMPKGDGKKVNLTAYPHHKNPGGEMAKLPASNSVTSGSIEDELANLRAASSAIRQIRLSAQRELEITKKMRTDAQRYQQEIETKARSQVQQLILLTRIVTRKEEDLLRKASAEIQKVLADVRMIRITAQEELAAQRKFTDAARISSLSMGLQEETEEPEGKRKKQLAGKK